MSSEGRRGADGPQEVVEALGVSAGQVYLAKHRISELIKKEVKSLETKMI